MKFRPTRIWLLALATSIGCSGNPDAPETTTPTVSAPKPAAGGDTTLPAPIFKASLVCFNGNADSRSSCRMTMADIEGGWRVVTSTLICGYHGAVSEITWTYRGQKNGNDVYHVVRKFPSDTDAGKTTETDVDFDGERHVLFEDQSQCIVIERQPL
jgi:hypothetical protein